VRAFSQHIGIGESRHTANPGHGFDQDLLSLSVKLSGEYADSRCVAIRPGERFYQSLPDHIVCDPNNGNAFGCLLHGANCHAASGKDDIDPCTDQLRRILRKQTNALPICAPFDG
jgi:hypothetical protein